MSAGTIMVIKGTAPLAMLGFGSQGYPLAHALDPPASTLMWNPGDTLGVSAAGDTIDAFSASVVAPNAPGGLSPALGATGTQITMSKSQDWTIAWTPGAQSGAHVLAVLSWSTAAEIKCVVGDATGTLSIPAGLLGNITVDGAELTLGRAVISYAPSTNATVEVVPIAFLYWGVQITP